MSDNNKVKVSFENSYMGDIKLAHMYVDNLSGKYMYIKFNFALNNMFHTTIEGEKDGKTKEFSVLLYPTDQHVYLTSFPILDRYKSWKYNYTYACSIADKPTESREIFDGVFFETFHMGFGSLIVALKNNNVLQNLSGEKHIQVKINYTTLQNLTPTKIYEDFVDLYDLRVLNELRIDDKNEKTTYKYKYFIKKPEKALTVEEISSSLLTHYSPNFSLFSSLLVERRELIPGVFGTLELTKSGSAVLSFENNNKTAVIITDVVVKGGEVSYVDENVSGRDANSPQLIVFPNETCKEFVQIKHPKGVFDISYECKVSEGKLVEENEVKPSLFVYAYFFKTFNSLLLAVKNNCEKAHMCYLFMKQMQNCTMDTDYSDQNKMMVKPYQTKLYSSIFLTDVTKPFVYSYAYQVSRVSDENDAPTAKQTLLASSDSTDVKSPELQAHANIERELELSATLTGIEYMSVVSDFVKSKIESGEVFVDTEFPAETDVSVYEPEFTGKRVEDIKWARASEILGNNYEIFCDGISADDIKQGCLGDCWMLSAVAAIAAQPYLIERLFSTRSVNKAGIYELNICTGGEWTRVVVDDKFPVNEYNNSIFAHNHSAELWVMLLEKAYAKVCGSYSKLISGFAEDAFEDFTGYPTFSIRINTRESSFNAQNMWNELCNLLKKKYFFCCSTSANSALEKVGLVSSHFYSLLDCKEAMGVKLVKLRNPWSKTEWTGDWCDDDTRWTLQAKKAFEHMECTDDGVFYMPYSEFINYFVSVTVCKYNQEYARNQVKVHCSPNTGNLEDKTTYPVAEIELAEDQNECYFGIHQRDQRYKDAPKTAAGMAFVVLEKNTGSIVGGSPFSSGRSSYTKGMSLKAGNYLLVPVVHSKDSAFTSFVISSHTTGKRTALRLMESGVVTIGDKQKTLLEVYGMAVQKLGNTRETPLKEARKRATLTSYTWGTSIAYGTDHNKNVSVELAVTRNNIVDAVFAPKFDLTVTAPLKVVWIGYCQSPRDGFSYSSSFSFSYLY